MMKNEVDEQTSRNGRPSAPVSPVGAARSTRAGEGATPSAVLAGSILLTGPTGGLGGALLEAIARRQPHHLILLGRASEQFEATKTLARVARPDTNESTPDSTAGSRAYATSKLGVLYLAHAWQTRYRDRLRVNVFDPGLMPGTGLARDQRGVALWAWKHVMPALTFLPGWSTPRASAERLAALALGEQYSDVAGGYDEMGEIKKSSAESYDADREMRLWEVCETLTAAQDGPRPEGVDIPGAS